VAKKDEYKNPFFRGEEHEFDGGDMEVRSPVGSIFDEGYVHKGTNAMESGLAEQVPTHSKKGAK